jgi:GDP-L-fucose synthase
MEKNAKIYVADNDGLVGGAILTELEREGYEHALPPGKGPKLTDSAEVDEFFARHRPSHVFLVGGKTGGIKGNQLYPAILMRDNLLVNCHVIESAHLHGVEKLLYLASSCVYPKFSEQPMKVEYVTSGKLEPTNEPYAIAKLAGLVLCQAYRRQFGRRFITAIPANVFGPGDNFNLEDSHVIAALMRRMHEAKSGGKGQIEVWGSGRPRREFIFSEDIARACLFLMDTYDGEEPINIGVGCDWSIREIAGMIREVVDYTGALDFDETKPDGMPAKLLDSSPLAQMGWKPRTPIRTALSITYDWFVRQGADADAEGTGDVRANL